MPLYPSALIGGKTWDDDKSSANARGRKIWVPIFDKHGLTAGFENHVHSFKRSAPMLNSQKKKDGKGVVYFGDGCWGVTSFDIPSLARMSTEDGRLMSVGQQHHVWIARINGTAPGARSSFSAIGTGGNVLHTSTLEVDEKDGRAKWEV